MKSDKRKFDVFLMPFLWWLSYFSLQFKANVLEVEIQSQLVAQNRIDLYFFFLLIDAKFFSLTCTISSLIDLWMLSISIYFVMIMDCIQNNQMRWYYWFVVKWKKYTSSDCVRQSYAKKCFQSKTSVNLLWCKPETTSTWSSVLYISWKLKWSALALARLVDCLSVSTNYAETNGSTIQKQRRRTTFNAIQRKIPFWFDSTIFRKSATVAIELRNNSTINGKLFSSVNSATL